MKLHMRKVGDTYESKGLRGESLTVVGNRVYCFGGNDSRYFGAVFYTDSFSWKALKNIFPTTIRVRSYHAAVLVDDKIYMHGGSNGPRFFDELVEFDPVLCKCRKIVSPKSRKRGGASAVFAKSLRQIVFFGGLSYENRSHHWNDIFTLDIDTFQWASVTPKGELPPPRSGHSAVLADRHMYIFGGFAGGNRYMNDLWIADLQGRSKITWSMVQQSAVSPATRAGPCLNKLGRTLVLLGGRNNFGQVPDEIFLFSLEKKEWTAGPGKLDRLTGRLPNGHRYTAVDITDAILYFTTQGLYKLTQVP